MNGDRDCRIYRFYVLDPHTGYTKKTLGYIGETVRMPFQRLMEHIYEQPWADTIVGWEVDDTVYPNKAAVLKAEEAAVKAELPLYNVEYNMENPRRIKPWEAKQQAEERGAGRRPRSRSAASNPQRQPSLKPARQSRKPAVSKRSRRAEPVPPRWFEGVLATVVVWLALVVALWVVRPDGGPKGAAGWATGLVAGVWVMAKRKRRRR